MVVVAVVVVVVEILRRRKETEDKSPGFALDPSEESATCVVVAAAGAAAETLWASFANIEKMESEGGSPGVVASGAAFRMGEEVDDEAVRVARRAAVGRTDRFAASAGDGGSKSIRD